MIEWENLTGDQQVGMPVLGAGLTLSQHTDGRPLITSTGSLPVGTTGKYLRYGISSWLASDLLAADLTGTIASARLAGAYSGITGLGTLGSLSVSGDITEGASILSSKYAPISHVSLDRNSAHDGAVLDASNGGTGRATLTQHAILAGNGTGLIQMISGATLGHVLTWNASGAPTFQAIPGGSGVVTFNGRSGAVVPALGDYSGFFSQLGHGHGAGDITAGTFPLGDFAFQGVISAGGVRVPQVIASTGTPTGTAPEGTIWLQYT